MCPHIINSSKLLSNMALWFASYEVSNLIIGNILSTPDSSSVVALMQIIVPDYASVQKPLS